MFLTNLLLLGIYIFIFAINNFVLNSVHSSLSNYFLRRVSILRCGITGLNDVNILIYAVRLFPREIIPLYSATTCK